MKRLLSTRVLSSDQKALLPENLLFEAYDAIRVRRLPVEMADTGSRLGLFSSGHAVAACFERPGEAPVKMPACCCVGEKTAARLRAHGQDVWEVADSAANLAARLIKKYNDRSFVYFCGNRRREELPSALRETGIPLEEVVVYRTELVQKSFSAPFDAILFFSPSGVSSFVARNDLKGVCAICIGPTTAREARKYTDRLIIAEKPSVEQVVLSAKSALI